LNKKIEILGDKIADARFKRKFLPKISKSLGCDTNSSIQQQELCILNTIKKRN